MDGEACPRYMNGVENIIHCLRDCTDSRSLWFAFGFGSIPRFFSMEMTSWILHFLKGQQSSVFLLVLWWC